MQNDLVNTFINYFWCSTPSNWHVNLKRNKHFVQINVVIQDNGIKLSKRCPINIIKKHNDNIEDLIRVILKEIKEKIKEHE